MAETLPPAYVQYDIVEATFKPKRTDDLKPSAAEWIGRRTQWQAMWVIEEGDYAEQFAFGIEPEEQMRRMKAKEPLPPFIWVPECDLEIHALVKGSFLRDE